MRFAFASFLLSLAIVGCNGFLESGTRGSGVSKSEIREVSTFTKLRITLPAHVEVVRGEIPTLEVTTDDNLVPFILTQMNGDELVISSRGSFNTSIGIQVKITASALTRIETSSASQLDVQDATADDLELVLSGASHIDWSGNAKKLSTTASGASQATLKSPINDLDIELSGASELHGFDATTANAQIKASGASRVEVNVAGKLDAKASGASTIVYAGNPQATTKATGASTIRAK